MYKIQYGEDGRDIYVSGSHLVWDPLDEKFLPVEEYAKSCIENKHPNVCHVTEVKCHELSCLITSNHTIPIGQWIFHDWEDNNGSPAKSLER